jgi:polyisoprenoid-binding protein YceI
MRGRFPTRSVFNQGNERTAATDVVARLVNGASAMNLRRLALAASLCACTLATVAAHAALARAGDAQVSFTATGPGGLSIVGSTSELTVAETADQVVVTVPLRNLDTKIDLRNKHMRDKYLEVGKYPNAELRVAKSAVSAPSGKTTGQLTLHGKTQPVTFNYTTKPEGAVTSVTSKFRIAMPDFGIEKPGYSGLSVKPDVDVDVSFHVTKN